MGVPAEAEAVAAFTRRPVDSLRIERPSVVVADDGERWLVTVPGFEGLASAVPSPVLVVGPDVRDGSSDTVWLGDLPGRGWTPLDDEGALAELLRALPDLPGATRAQLLAAVLGPRGPETVFRDPAQVAAMLEEVADRVPEALRAIAVRERAAGGWELDFVGIGLHKSGQMDPYRVTAARWQVSFEAGRLKWTRDEMVSDIVLARYGGRQASS